MYNQGYNPEYSDMADLVEARIEQLIDLVAATPKFSDYISQKFGVKLSQGQGSPSATLTESMRAEGSPETVDFTKMSDEEQQKYALAQALAAREEALRKLGKA
jgi:hypothetical protein